jgi:hypothetical protein
VQIADVETDDSGSPVQKRARTATPDAPARNRASRSNSPASDSSEDEQRNEVRSRGGALQRELNAAYAEDHKEEDESLNSFSPPRGGSPLVDPGRFVV